LRGRIILAWLVSFQVLYSAAWQAAHFSDPTNAVFAVAVGMIAQPTAMASASPPIARIMRRTRCEAMKSLP